MYAIDQVNGLALSPEAVMQMDSARVSNIETFKAFSEGLSVDEAFLQNPRWSQGNSDMSSAGQFAYVMQEMLPTVYDAAHLEGMGGSLNLRLTGVADFTVLAVNGRVVVMNGLSVDVETGEEVVDLELAPEVFAGYARHVLLEHAEAELEDDEDEDRELSDAELRLYGMPAGGMELTAGQQIGSFAGLLDIATSAAVAACAANNQTAATGTCGANASACGANVGVGENNCAANASACGANATVQSSCAANASACGANAAVNSNCAANASACGANVGVSALNNTTSGVSACGVNLNAGESAASICAVDFIPGLPSC